MSECKTCIFYKKICNGTIIPYCSYYKNQNLPADCLFCQFNMLSIKEGFKHICLKCKKQIIVSDKESKKRLFPICKRPWEEWK